MNCDEQDKQLVVRDEAPYAVVRQAFKGGSLIRSIISYEPSPVASPRVDGAFAEMSLVPRTLESLRYSMFLLEYKVSPNGWLRAWLLLWIRLVVLLVIPAVGAALLLEVLVPVFARLAEIAAYTHAAAKSAFYAFCWLIAIIILLAAFIAGGIAALRAKKK